MPAMMPAIHDIVATYVERHLQVAVDAIREAMAAPAPEDRLSFGDALARLEESSPT